MNEWICPLGCNKALKIRSYEDDKQREVRETRILAVVKSSRTSQSHFGRLSRNAIDSFDPKFKRPLFRLSHLSLCPPNNLL